MTKKHFEALAKAVKMLPQRDITKDDVAAALVFVCWQFNDNFDPDRFLKACGVKE